MAVDGSLIFDTGVDSSGFSAGLGKLTTAATQAAKVITTAFTAASAAAVKVGSDFEASMSQVAATMGITSAAEEFEILSAAAKKMGEETKFSASQAGEALNYLALAGYDAEKAVSALPMVLNVAAAGGMDLAYASDLITDAMSALGLETAQMSTFADQLAVTAQKSNTSVSQLGEAILTVGGTAKTLSGGVTEMNTALGILADNGIKGAEGGTALRNVILSLSAPTSTAAEALENLGVSAFDASGTMRPLEDTFADLNAALSKLSDQEKTAVLNEIFNKVDLKSVNALLGTSAERFDQLSGYISECEGAAADMAKTMDDNLKGDITILGSALEGAGIAAYEKFQVPMRTAVQEVTAAVGELTESLTDGELSDSMDKVASAFSGIAGEALALLANDVLPAVIDGFALVVEHGNMIISVATGIGAAFVAWKVAGVVASVVVSFQTANVQLALLALQSGNAAVAQTALAGGLSLTEIAAALFTGKITLATAAQSAFNTVVTANPLGLLLTAIVAVTAGLVVYANTVDSVHNKIRDINKSIKELNQNTEDSIAASEGEIAVIENKAAKYEELRNKINRTAGEEEQLKNLAEELQQYMPEGTQLIDEQTGAYNSLADSIDNVTESMRRKATISAYEEQYAGLIKQQLEAEKALEEAKQNFAKYEGYTLKANPFMNTGFNIAKRELEEAAEAYKKINDEIDYLDDKISGLYEESSSALSTTGIDSSSASPWGDYFKKQNEEANAEFEEWQKKNAQELAKLQTENTQKMQEEWEQAEHDYATNAIKSEEALYAKKREIWGKYGDESLKDHWSYYEELCQYDKDFAEQAADEEEQAIRDKWDNINRLNQMGLITDEEAMKRRKQFIADYYPEYSDEAYEYYKQIYDDENEIAAEALAEQEDIVEDGLSAILKKYQEAYDELDRKRQNYRDKLLSVGGDLFSVDVSEDKNGNEATTYTVNNLDEQLKKMREYHRQITALKNQGASEGLLEELTSMDDDDSAQFAKYLSGMSASEFAKINELYKEKQKLADELSDEMYTSEAEKISQSMTDALSDLATSAYSYGASAAQQFSAGFNEAMSELGVGVLYNQIQAIGASKTYENYVTTATNSGSREVAVSVDVTGKSTVYLNGKAVGEAVTDYQGQQAIITGK